MTKSNGNATAGYAMVAIAAIAWGTWPLILKRAESYGGIDPAIETLAVMLTLSLASAPLLFRDRVPKRASWRGWSGVAWLGLADALNVILFFKAYQSTSVAIAVITHYLAPLFVALAAPIFLSERARFQTFAATFAGFFGLILMLRPWSTDHGKSDLVGAAMGAGSALFYASNVIVNKRLAPNFSGSELMFFHGFIAIPLLAILVPHGAWHSIDLRALAWLFTGALGPGAIAALLFVWGLRRIPASHASTLTLLEPLVAVALGTIVLGQRLYLFSILGALIILASAIFVMRPSRMNARI